MDPVYAVRNKVKAPIFGRTQQIILNATLGQGLFEFVQAFLFFRLYNFCPLRNSILFQILLQAQQCFCPLFLSD